MMATDSENAGTSSTFLANPSTSEPARPPDPDLAQAQRTIMVLVLVHAAVLGAVLGGLTAHVVCHLTKTLLARTISLSPLRTAAVGSLSGGVYGVGLGLLHRNRERHADNHDFNHFVPLKRLLGAVGVSAFVSALLTYADNPT